MGNIVTFYSYKGGVGRSMTLANIAVELATKKKKVLMVDWDLEAPGLEKYFLDKRFVSEQVSERGGLLQLLVELQKGTSLDYKKHLTEFTFGNSTLSLIPSGRDNDPVTYSKVLGSFSWDKFFVEGKGGYHLERIRQEWLNDFDFVLIDSRTGLSDSSGICTILMPDILIPMFTANYQSLFGVRDIVSYIHSARQNLKVDRMALTVLPIPCRFGTRVEFKESQEWLVRMADILKDCFGDWLPAWIEPKHVLEQIKIPQVDYFGFGEKLAVIEQGTSDPESMGYVYSKIAALIMSEFRDVKTFVGEDYYLNRQHEYENEKQLHSTAIESEYKYDVYISHSRESYQWVSELLLPALLEYLEDLLGRTPRIVLDSREIAAGEDWSKKIHEIIHQSETFLFFVSINNLSQTIFELSLLSFSDREKKYNTQLIFPLLLGLPESKQLLDDLRTRGIIDKHELFDFTQFLFAETLNSTKRRTEFGQQVARLASAISNAVKTVSDDRQKMPNEKRELQVSGRGDLLALAKQYELLRQTMSAGDERTEAMTSIVQQMHKRIKSNENYFPFFGKSKIAGERLIVIAQLQLYPRLEYLGWLAEHVGNIEKPFIGYHATVAIFIAVRAFKETHRSEVIEIVKKADRNLYLHDYKDPNQISVLQSARAELVYK